MDEEYVECQLLGETYTFTIKYEDQKMFKLIAKEFDVMLQQERQVNKTKTKEEAFILAGLKLVSQVIAMQEQGSPRNIESNIKEMIEKIDDSIKILHKPDKVL